ncbi:hypothetical protein WA026_007859 [Henosepilachna vigintioctopunctata]|uniref:HTH psq-type domain-containing protein n=1 Tax=Henosepilachna vigintioctopunctata TaxID=420089 RepID=A0AAW1U4I3_9CUCU
MSIGYSIKLLKANTAFYSIPRLSAPNMDWFCNMEYHHFSETVRRIEPPIVRAMASTNSTAKGKIRQTWDKDAMANSIKALRDKQMDFLKASKTYGVPKTTLILLTKMED